MDNVYKGFRKSFVSGLSHRILTAICNILNIRYKRHCASLEMTLQKYIITIIIIVIIIINTFICSRTFLENHTRFQAKMGKVHTRFQTKTAPKPYPLKRHIPTCLI